VHQQQFLTSFSTVYLRKTVGVGRLRKVHGSTRNRGSRPSHHVDASGSVDRKILQALEKIGVVEKDEEKGGRRITQSGQRDLGKSYFTVSLYRRQDHGSCLREFDIPRHVVSILLQFSLLYNANFLSRQNCTDRSGGRGRRR
jgi:hypothetical protein